mgnify:CR=1 FL=1
MAIKLITIWWIVLKRNDLKKSQCFLVSCLLLTQYIFCQDTTINLYGGNHTFVFGNQTNNYQPTEILKQNNQYLKEILKTFKVFVKDQNSELNRTKEIQAAFFDQVENYISSITAKDKIIDSLTGLLKERSQELEVAKDLIAQSKAVESSSKLLIKTVPFFISEKNDTETISFKRSEIESRDNFISVYSYDKASPTAVVRKFNRYGFINRSGNLIIGFKYEKAENFQEGLAVVLKGDKYGYITEADQVQIPFEYSQALSFRDGKALVCKNGNWYFINIDGRKVGEIKLDKSIAGARYFKGDGRICITYSDDTETLLNKNGKFIWNFEPTSPVTLWYFKSFKHIFELNSPEIYKVQFTNGTYGLVDDRLKTISKKYLSDFSFDENNLAIVHDKVTDEKKVNGSTTLTYESFYNVMNDRGQELLEKPYSKIEVSSFGAYRVQGKYARWGLLDPTMSEKVKCEYHSIKQLANDISLVSQIESITNQDSEIIKTRYGIIDENGFTFIPVRFDSIFFLENKYFQVAYNGNTSNLELIRQLKIVDVHCLTNCTEYSKFILLKQD